MEGIYLSKSDKKDEKLDPHHLLEDLLEIMVWGSKNKIFLLTYTSDGGKIELHKRRKFSTDEYIKLLEKLDSMQNRNKYEVVKYFVDYLQFSHNKSISYEDANDRYITLISSSDKKFYPGNSPSKQQQDHFFKQNSTDPSGVSDPQFKSPEKDFDELGAKAKSKFDFWGIYISKIPRDHGITLSCIIDNTSDLFKQMITHKNAVFNQTNGWAPIITKREGIPFSVNLHKNGSFQLYLQKMVEPDTFIHFLFKEFGLLPEKCFFELVEKLEDARSSKFCRVELANRVDPEKLAVKFLKGSHLNVKNVRWGGRLTDLQIKVDWSDGYPEFETQGEEIPSLITRDLVVDPMNALRGISYMNEKMDDIVIAQSMIYSGMDEINTHVDTLSLESVGTREEIREFRTESNECLKSISQTNTKMARVIETQAVQEVEFFDQANVILDRISKNQEYYGLEAQIQIENLTKQNQRGFSDIDNGLAVVNQTIEEKTSDIIKQVQNSEWKIHKNIQGHNQLVQKKFTQLIELIDTIPGQTISFYQRSIKMSQSTVYRYFQELIDSDIIQSEKFNPLLPVKGRKFRLFFIKKHQK